jgi:hypothetical protein
MEDRKTEVQRQEQLYAEKVADLREKIETAEERVMALDTNDPELEDARREHIALLDELAELGEEA